MSAALTETVLQYEDIKRVFLIVNGTAPANMPGDGFRHDPGRIASPGPPTGSGPISHRFRALRGAVSAAVDARGPSSRRMSPMSTKSGGITEKLREPKPSATSRTGGAALDSWRPLKNTEKNFR